MSRWQFARRGADRATVAGFLCIGFGVYLHTHGRFSEWPTLALMVLGGLLVQGESIIGAVRAWRSRNGTPPAEP